jgi:hypothetical protein
MAKFRIELENQNQRILLMDYDSTIDKKDGFTFNEELSEQENDLFNLDFSIPEKVGRNKEINLGNLIAIGRPLWLYLYNPDKAIRMVITSYTPVVGSENSIFRIKAQDYASYNFTRNNAGLNLDTIEDEEFLDWLEQNFSINDRKTNTINIGNYILERGWLRTKDDSNYIGWQTNYIGAQEKIFNIQLSGSNTYNGLIEIANITNTFLFFDYINKVVLFVDKEDPILDKDFTIKRNFNLQNIERSYKGDNLYSLFYVEGGVDEFGLNTILSDETGYKDNFLYNLDYAVEKGLITQNEFNLIEEEIEDNLKDINEKLRVLIRERYETLEDINKANSRIDTLTDRLVLSNNFEDYINNYNNLVSEFYRKGASDTEVTEPISTSTFLATWSNLPLKSTLPATGSFSFNFPVRIRYDGVLFIFEQSTDEIIIDEETDLKIKLSFTASANEIVSSKGYSIYYTIVSGTGFNANLLSVVSSIASYVETVIYNTLTFIFPYFDLLFQYDGIAEIEKREEKINKEIEDIKEFWDEDYSELDDLNLNTTDPVEKARIAFLEQRINDYKIAIGDYNPETQILNTTVPGKFTLIKGVFDSYYNQYTSPNIKPIMERYRETIQEKQTFWYNLKNTYGQHIFLEGYYSNTIESSPENLKNQAEAIYREHQKPIEDFSITYIDVKDIIGINIQDLKVGDYVKIRDEYSEIQEIEDSKLQVSGITRSLRNSSNIQLKILRYNMINKILEKIIAGSQS